jgi:hypothetical protein
VDSLVALNLTNYEDALRKARDEINANRRLTASPFIIMLTDGRQTTGGSPMDEANDLKNNLGVRIFTMGLGLAPADQQILKDIASDPDSTFFRAIATSAELANVYNSVLVTLQCGPRATATPTNTPTQVIAPPSATPTATPTLPVAAETATPTRTPTIAKPTDTPKPTTPTATPTRTPTPGAVIVDTYLIAAPADDAYSRNTYCTTNSIKLGDVAGEDITAGLRFLNLQKRPGKTLVDARLEFPAAANGGTVSLRIFAHDVDNAATFDCGANQPHTRTTTAAAVDWATGPWTAGLTYTTPNLASVVNAVLNRAGWANGNALALLIRDNGSSTNIQARNFELGAPVVRLVLTWQ